MQPSDSARNSPDPDLPKLGLAKLGLPQILLIDDDILSGARLFAEIANIPFEVKLVRSSAQGFTEALSHAWTAIVIDLRSPVDSGLELCKTLLSLNPKTPLLLVCESRSSLQYLLGLEIGAADCLARPYDPREMLVRLKGIVRRSLAYLGDMKRLESNRSKSKYGALMIDTASRIATFESKVLELTPREFDLLAFLALHSGAVFSRSDLLKKVWQSSYKGEEHTVHSHINRLRQKLGDTRGKPKYIHTVWSKGYRFEATQSSEPHSKMTPTSLDIANP
jgi:DNA-binding response OmpR family regulator